MFIPQTADSAALLTYLHTSQLTTNLPNPSTHTTPLCVYYEGTFSLGGKRLSLKLTSMSRWNENRSTCCQLLPSRAKTFQNLDTWAHRHRASISR